MFRTIGQRITLKPFAGPAERTRPVAGKKVYLGVDVPLLLVVVTLAIFGALMVYSASYDYSQVNYGSPTYMFERQMLWLALGIGVVVFLTFFDYHRWRKLIIPAMAFTIVSLILVLIVNE
ncbi:MAG TPA: FtsW/RodA/SpoVE family cell cycle protein, partial [Anaerolineales bacterium]